MKTGFLLQFSSLPSTSRSTNDSSKNIDRYCFTVTLTHAIQSSRPTLIQQIEGLWPWVIPPVPWGHLLTSVLKRPLGYISLSWGVPAITQVVIQDEAARIIPTESKYNFLELFLRCYRYRLCYFSRIIQKLSYFTSLAALLTPITVFHCAAVRNTRQ